MPPDVKDVLEVLERFQQGYIHRDPQQVDAFMELFVLDDELEVIGTNASGVDRGEWCLGPEMARTLFVDDWNTWGDLRLNIPAAKITVVGDAAWLSVPGTVSKEYNRRESYENYLEFVRELLDGEEDPQHKVLRIQLGCANTLFELERGEHFVWPLVLTAVLVRSAGRWLFAQMRFGFPTTRYPDERLV